MLLPASLSSWFCRTIISSAAFFPPTSVLLQQTYRGWRANTYDRRRARQWHSAAAVATDSHTLSGAFRAILFAISEVSDRAGFGSRNSLTGQATPQSLHWLWKCKMGTSTARKAHGRGLSVLNCPKITSNLTGYHRDQRKETASLCCWPYYFAV